MEGNPAIHEGITFQYYRKPDYLQINNNSILIGELKGSTSRTDRWG
jgi:hypothetical protein